MKTAGLIAASLSATALGGPVLQLWVSGGRQINGDFVSINVGEGTFAFLRRDGTLYIPPGIHGANNLPPGQYTAAACGGENDDHEWVVAIRSDGTLAAAGYPGSGVLAPPPGQFVAVAAGERHGVALSPDGTLTGWGAIGTVPAPAGTFTSIAAAARYTLAIRTDGTLAYWGHGLYGPSAVPPGEFIAVSAGETHALAIRDDGTLVAWGGDPYASGILNPPPGTYRAVAAGTAFDAAIRTDGTVAIWGTDVNGAPPPVAPAGQFLDVRVNSFVAAVLTDRCYANCDQSTTAPVLNVADFACFLNQFADGRWEANCDNSITAPYLNVQDFVCFLNHFAAGCAK